MRSLTICILLCSNCALERPPTTFPAQQLDDAGAGDATSRGDASFGSGSGAGTMTGTWLQVHEASTCVLVDEQVTWAGYLMNIEQTDRTLVEHRQQCEVTLSPVFGLQVIIPDPVLPLIKFVEVDQGFVSSVLESGTYTSSTELSLWGIELENPLTDSVPTEPDDPAVVDSDGDGNPGLTFDIVGSMCKRYIAQRSIVRYFGRFTKPNQIDGSSVTVTDANVVGSSQAICGVDPRLTANDPLSTFRMVRVDGAGESIDLDADGDGEITCDEVRPHLVDIIARRESSPENCR